MVIRYASRPESFGLPEDTQPKPSMSALWKLPAGWAVETITSLIVELNVAAGTKPPSWLTPIARRGDIASTKSPTKRSDRRADMKQLLRTIAN
jgi:hypothetical protein